MLLLDTWALWFVSGMPGIVSWASEFVSCVSALFSRLHVQELHKKSPWQAYLSVRMAALAVDLIRIFDLA